MCCRHVEGSRQREPGLRGDLSLDAEPCVETARSMTAGVLSTLGAHRKWSRAIRAVITADAVVGKLTPATGVPPSLHPALLRYTTYQIRGEWTAGPDAALSMAVGSAVGVTQQPHTLRSLAVLQPAERRLPRALAAGEYSRSDMEAVAAGHASCSARRHCVWTRASLRASSAASTLRVDTEATT